MKDDPIVEEVRRVRERLLAESGSIAEFMARATAATAQAGLNVVTGNVRLRSELATATPTR